MRISGTSISVAPSLALREQSYAIESASQNFAWAQQIREAERKSVFGAAKSYYKSFFKARSSEPPLFMNTSASSSAVAAAAVTTTSLARSSEPANPNSINITIGGSANDKYIGGALSEENPMQKSR